MRRGRNVKRKKRSRSASKHETRRPRKGSLRRAERARSIEDAKRDPEARRELKRRRDANPEAYRKLSGQPHPAFEAWKNGASIRDLVVEHKMTRSQMRKLLTTAAGGKDAFKALRAQGAGGSVQPFGGKRASGSAPVAPVDQKALDKKAKRLKSSKRWQLDIRFEPMKVINAGEGKVKVLGGNEYLHGYRGPSGQLYVEAKANERADVILRFKTLGLPPLRLRKLDEKLLKKWDRERVEEERRGQLALERVSERKAKARAERKAKRGKGETRAARARRVRGIR